MKIINDLANFIEMLDHTQLQHSIKPEISKGEFTGTVVVVNIHYEEFDGKTDFERELVFMFDTNGILNDIM